MKFIDTHTHLYDEQLLPDDIGMIERCLANRVVKMYMPNCDSSTIDGMMKIAASWPEHCFPMMGLHPCYVKGNVDEELNIVKDWLQKKKFYAVGEIGLDKYWDLQFLPQQINAFETQIDWALEYDLPIVIHSREATQDCIDIVKQKQDGGLRGIFHCFSGTIEEAEAVVSMGLLLGIGGVVTYKKTNLPEIISTMGLKNIVLETDAPYLATVPYRGKRNESSYIPLIAERVADILQIPIQEVAFETTRNAENIFR